MLAAKKLGTNSELVAAVNYLTQKAVLNDFVANSALMQQVSEVVAAEPHEHRRALAVRTDDLLAHLNTKHPAPKDHKNAALIQTVLANGPRALKLLYEVVEDVAKQIPAPPAPAGARAKIQQQIREDLAVPAIHRVPYTLKLVPPEQLEPTCLHALRGHHAGHCVEIRGLVSRVSPARPLIQLAVYRCESCGAFSYHPVESTTFTPMKHCERDAVCRKKRNTLKLSLEDSNFVASQSVWVQELPENVPSGKVPHQIKLVVKGHELANLLRPGRSVRVRGFYVVEPPSHGWGAAQRGSNGDGGAPLIDVQAIEELDSVAVNFTEVRATAELVRAQYATGHMLYHTLSDSLAPAIHGHEDVKRALLLQLVGGVRIDDKIRGSFHVLLVGDPGIAKSQLLLRICRVSPRSKYTCGRGVSGVGLTACVTKDAGTGEFTLQAGATVLADQGICCIDEFDKMNEQDRTAIHEVMEQQTVSISKAGIVATLNARTSILAAANPIGGRYNLDKSVMENVGLPAALLSRFDFVFLMLDECTNRQKDVDMARHLLSVHRSQHTLTAAESSAHVPTPVMREIVAEAQKRRPYLPRSLHAEVTNRYVSARASQNQHENYVTARTLTGLMRVSQALAKLRFADEISLEDIVEAERLLHASKRSVTERLLEKKSANLNSAHKAASAFLVSLAKGDVVHNYDECARIAAQTHSVDISDFDAVLNELVNIGQFVFTDITKSNFKWV